MDSLPPPPPLQMDELPPGLAESVLQAIKGLPVWEHLPSDYCFPGSVDCSDLRRRPKTAFRATSPAMCRLADGLITQLGEVWLGKGRTSGEPAQDQEYSDEASSWGAGQQLQQQRVKSMLGRLTSLQGVQIVLSDGGLSQLVQLVQEGLLARVKELRVQQAVRGSLPFPSVPAGLLAEGMPLLEQLSLHLPGGASPLLVALPMHNSLKMLALSGRFQLPPDFFAGLSGCSNLRSLLLQDKILSVPADVAQLTQLTRLSSCGPLDLASVSALTGLQQLELGTLEGMVGPASLTALTALTGLKLGSERGSDNGPLRSNAARELAANLWQELQSLTSLAWLELGRQLCEVQAMWTSPSAWHHQHLTRLHVAHLQEVSTGPWNGQSTASLPALQDLDVDDASMISCVCLEALHVLLHAATNLVTVRMSGDISYHATAAALGVDEATRLLGEVCSRLGALEVIENSCGIRAIRIVVLNALGDVGSDGGSDDDDGNPQQQFNDRAEQLMLSLEPLAAVDNLILHLNIKRLGHRAMAALHSALPNVEGLYLDSTITRRAMQLLPKFERLRLLELRTLLSTHKALAIFALEGLQLTELTLDYESSAGLSPWSHSRQHCSLPTLKALNLNCFSVPSLQDLHYLLHAAANLETLRLEYNVGIEVSSRGGMYSHDELLQQLLDVLSRLAELKVDLTYAFELWLQRDWTWDVTPMLKAVTQFLDKVDKPPMKLKLDFEVELTPEAAGALVCGMPKVQHLKLRNCRIEQPTVLDCLAKLGQLQSIVLMNVAGPAELALHLAMFRVTAPAVEVEVQECGWWTAQHQEEMEQGLEAFSEEDDWAYDDDEVDEDMMV